MEMYNVTFTTKDIVLFYLQEFIQIDLWVPSVGQCFA